MKEIIGKIKFGVVGIPSDVTWFSLTDNFMGEFINKSLNLKGGKFLQYGTKESVYYSPETFYCVEKYSNPILVGKLSEITEEQAAEVVDGCEDGFGNYLNAQLKWFDTAKESLVSLLKANDVWIKEWKDAPIKPELGHYCEGETSWESYDNRLEDYHNETEYYNKLPDDFLIIKL